MRLYEKGARFKFRIDTYCDMKIIKEGTCVDIIENNEKNRFYLVKIHGHKTLYVFYDDGIFGYLDEIDPETEKIKNYQYNFPFIAVTTGNFIYNTDTITFTFFNTWTG